MIEAALAAGLQAAVVTFDPHPRVALGNRVELISTLERRLELIEALGVTETLVVPFTPDLSLQTPEEFAATSSSRWARGSSLPARTSASAAGARATSRCSPSSASMSRPVPLVEGVSSSRIRQLAGTGEVDRAAKLLGRPVEVEGTVVAGDARGGTLGFPTANLAVPSDLLVPAFGIYAGEALGMRTAMSIGVNPHYGGEERRSRGLPARLRGRPLRPPARGRALASACARSGHSTRRPT